MENYWQSYQKLSGISANFEPKLGIVKLYRTSLNYQIHKRLTFFFFFFFDICAIKIYAREYLQTTSKDTQPLKSNVSSVKEKVCNRRNTVFA